MYCNAALYNLHKKTPMSHTLLVVQLALVPALTDFISHPLDAIVEAML
jgi:hypothetical protein